MATSDVYGDQYSAERNAQRTKAEIGSDADLIRSRLNQDYRFTRSTLDRAFQKGLGTISDDFASRGMYLSGIRREEQQNLGEGYANDTGAAIQGLQRQLEDLDRASTKGLLGVSTGLEGQLFASTGESLSSILQRALNDAKAQVG